MRTLFGILFMSSSVWRAEICESLFEPYELALGYDGGPDSSRDFKVKMYSGMLRLQAGCESAQLDGVGKRCAWTAHFVRTRSRIECLGIVACPNAGDCVVVIVDERGGGKKGGRISLAALSPVLGVHDRPLLLQLTIPCLYPVNTVSVSEAVRLYLNATRLAQVLPSLR